MLVYAMRTGSPKIQKLAAANRAEADAAALDLWDRIRGEAEALSLQGLADRLNELGVPTPRGGRWHKTSAARLVERVRAAEGTITWAESLSLRRAITWRMERLRECQHPNLANLARALETLPEPPEGAPAAERCRPGEMLPRDRPPVQAAMSLYHDELEELGLHEKAAALAQAARRLWPDAEPITLQEAADHDPGTLEALRAAPAKRCPTV